MERKHLAYPEVLFLSPMTDLKTQAVRMCTGAQSGRHEHHNYQQLYIPHNEIAKATYTEVITGAKHGTKSQTHTYNRQEEERQHNIAGIGSRSDKGVIFGSEKIATSQSLKLSNSIGQRASRGYQKQTSRAAE